MTNLTTLCEKCVERMDALNLKGKKRDEATLHFVCGFISALEPCVQEAAGYFVFNVSVRGFMAIKEQLAEKPIPIKAR